MTLALALAADVTRNQLRVAASTPCIFIKVDPIASLQPAAVDVGAGPWRSNVLSGNVLAFWPCLAFCLAAYLVAPHIRPSPPAAPNGQQGGLCCQCHCCCAGYPAGHRLDAAVQPGKWASDRGPDAGRPQLQDVNSEDPCKTTEDSTRGTIASGGMQMAAQGLPVIKAWW